MSRRALSEGWPSRLLFLVLVAAALFHLATIVLGLLPARTQRATHFLFMLPLAFVLYPARAGSRTDRISKLDLLLAGTAIVVNAYLLLNAPVIAERWEGITPLSPLELVLGCVAILLCLEAVRRSAAAALSLVTAGFLGYLFWSLLHDPGMDPARAFRRLVEIMYLHQAEGIYGNLLGVSATYIALFVIFGAAVERTRIGDYFMQLAGLFVGNARGGAAKTAVVGSALFGGVVGQGTANIYATGPFTIPLMKKAGYKPAFAAGVEATASMGGALLPPVMGTAAFVMIETLGVPLINLIQRAVIPAIFYFVGVFLIVHFRAALKDTDATRMGLRVPVRDLATKIYLAVPLIVLVVLLVYGFSALRAGLVAVLLAMGTTLVRRRPGKSAPGIVLDVLATGTRNTVMIAVSCAAAGMVVGAIAHSGLAVSLGSLLAASMGDFTPMILVVTMLLALLLGMGLPATPAYILTATLLVPGLTLAGIDTMQAHLFVFYFAILACITPPVCLCSFAAAGLAEADPMRTGLEGLRVGFAGFVVPYVFIYRPGLSLQGSALEVVVAISITSLAITAAAAGLIGWLLTRLSWWERALLLAAALALLVPSIYLTLAGLAAALLVGARQLRDRGLAERSRAASSAAGGGTDVGP